MLTFGYLAEITLYEGTICFASNFILSKLQVKSYTVKFQPSDDLHSLLRVARWCEVDASMQCKVYAYNIDTELEKIRKFWQIHTKNLDAFINAIPNHNDLIHVFHSNWHRIFA